MKITAILCVKYHSAIHNKRTYFLKYKTYNICSRGRNGPEFSARVRPEVFNPGPRPAGPTYLGPRPGPARSTQTYSLCLPELY